jgi:hypothetical protein
MKEICQLSGLPSEISYSQHCFAISLNILVNKITKAEPKKIIKLNNNSLKSHDSGYCIDYLFKYIEKAN